MNVYISYWPLGEYNDDPKLGIDWYPHSSEHIYKAYSLRLLFFGRTLEFAFVSNSAAYEKTHGKYSGFRLIPSFNAAADTETKNSYGGMV